jgi:2-oxoglutarate dehydrogenase E2 component (dihydrolipoamide succinyltransferase)
MLINIVIPAIAESVTTGVVTRIHKKQGEGVTKDEVLLDIEADKITFELPSPSIGAIAQWTIKEGDTVNVGQVVGTIDDKATGTVSAAAPAAKAAGSSATAVAPPPARATTAAAAASNGHAGDDIRATPLARKVATEHNVDLGKIAPTGPGNRVREQDVVAFVESKKADSGAKKPGVPASSGDSRGSRGVTRERMTPLRQRIASRLVQAQHTAAMLTTFNEVDMSRPSWRARTDRPQSRSTTTATSRSRSARPRASSFRSFATARAARSRKSKRASRTSPIAGATAN